MPFSKKVGLFERYDAKRRFLFICQTGKGVVDHLRKVCVVEVRALIVADLVIGRYIAECKIKLVGMEHLVQEVGKPLDFPEWRLLALVEADADGIDPQVPQGKHTEMVRRIGGWPVLVTEAQGGRAGRIKLQAVG